MNSTHKRLAVGSSPTGPTMKLKMIIAAVCLLAASCGNSSPDVPSKAVSRTIDVQTVTVDGRLLNCAVYKDGYGGGVSCNWEAFNAG